MGRIFGMLGMFLARYGMMFATVIVTLANTNVESIVT